MPNFGVEVGGAVVEDWADPADTNKPSRLNARVDRRNKRWVANLFQPVFVKATVQGAVGPPDTDLGGNLFSAQIVEAPHTGITAVVQTGGFSSVCRFLPMWPGHYTMGLWRQNGGGLILHFDVKP